ncbi:protein crossbronx homolog isoform X2 [Xenia sp. Carnegie-2017]|uniref:protein crossbronx homolog isoform X2 n=1 Tax=Xenia sp. Carnegie-2017 TaxID=2897299 RepID=UPI001F043913|nr:protein crossbronx homolog isoform X2 [Xenia sp. Carnegie-2017]
MPAMNNEQDSRTHVNGSELESEEFENTSRDTRQRIPVNVFGLSSKLKKETKKLLRYPGRALKRAMANDANVVSDDFPCEGDGYESFVDVNEDFSRYFIQHDIITEFEYLCKNPPDGVYVIPSIKSFQVWHGVIFLRTGPYRQGIFRFDILFKDKTLNIDKAFPCWNKENHVGDLLTYLKECFNDGSRGGEINIDGTDCKNENMEEFRKRAIFCVEKSIKDFMRESPVTSDDDGNLLKVKQLSGAAIEEWKRNILSEATASKLDE